MFFLTADYCLALQDIYHFKENHLKDSGVTHHIEILSTFISKKITSYKKQCFQLPVLYPPALEVFLINSFKLMKFQISLPCNFEINNTRN